MVLGRKLLVVLASASMVLAASGVASAHEDSAASKVTIQTAQGALKGKVTSGMKGCAKKREVTVFKTKNDKKVGSTKTNKRGKWSLDVNRLTGKYYAAVEEKVSFEIKDGVYLHLHVCRAGKSANVKA